MPATHVVPAFGNPLCPRKRTCGKPAQRARYVPIADIADATPQSKGLGKLSDSAVIVEPPEHPEEPALVMPEARSEATGHDRAAQTLSYS